MPISIRSSYSARLLSANLSCVSTSGLGPCTGQVLEVRDSTGVIQSPGFKDDRFPENSRCRWRIVGALEQVYETKRPHLHGRQLASDSTALT